MTNPANPASNSGGLRPLTPEEQAALRLAAQSVRHVLAAATPCPDPDQQLEGVLEADFRLALELGIPSPEIQIQLVLERYIEARGRVIADRLNAEYESSERTFFTLALLEWLEERQFPEDLTITEGINYHQTARSGSEE